MANDARAYVKFTCLVSSSWYNFVEWCYPLHFVGNHIKCKQATFYIRSKIALYNCSRSVAFWLKKHAMYSKTHKYFTVRHKSNLSTRVHSYPVLSVPT